MYYYCGNCMSTNVICEAKLKLNNDSDERGYFTLDEIEETSIVYCDDCDSNKIRTTAYKSKIGV